MKRPYKDTLRMAILIPCLNEEATAILHTVSWWKQEMHNVLFCRQQ
jgi:hypothetical protein